MKQDTYIRRFLSGFMALLVMSLSVALPMQAFAANTKKATPTPTVASVASTGPKHPTGVDAKTYTYNETTGLWTNDFYTWDPATGVTTPLKAQTYSYNPATQKWDTTAYVYVPATGTYQPQTVSVADKPNNSAVAPTASAEPSASAQPLAQNDTSTVAQGAYNGFYNAEISNTSNSKAQSGDASVTQNTKAEEAKTGAASVVSTFVNTVSTMWDATGQPLLSFATNLVGDVIGDLLFDPSSIAQSATTTTGTATVNEKAHGAITNDITSLATSGDATVSQNTSGGDAITGNATAVVNLVNTINSAIAAKQSFVGSITIDGNFTGDILLPPDVLNQILGSNAPAATVQSSQFADQKALSSVVGQSTIDNVIKAQAQSGSADVSQNTTAGSAITGDALNTLSVLNLTGREVIGSDALLVFVNVGGKWTGVIMNAPRGATAAALGGGIQMDSAKLSTSESSSLQSSDAIQNTVDVRAKSGDARVSQNTQAGDARTGKASTDVNIANITDSKFSLSQWFGVLFVNVMGDWFGSFGVKTNRTPVQSTSETATTALSAEKVRVFRFEAATSSGDGKGTRLVEQPIAQQPGSTSNAAAQSTNNKFVSSLPASTTAQGGIGRYAVSIVLALVSLALLGLERFIAVRRSRR